LVSVDSENALASLRESENENALSLQKLVFGWLSYV
jgi:hypothetical protein